MPTRNIHLTDEQDAFVEEVVRAGKYENASEAMRDAVRGLQHRIQADELKLDLLRAQSDVERMPRFRDLRGRARRAGDRPFHRG